MTPGWSEARLGAMPSLRWVPRLLVRAAVVALAGLALIPAMVSPALAHGRGTDATNYASRITAAPDLPGVSWAVYGGDELLEVTNETDVEVVVLGYDGEPYLRVGPDGVHENRSSPATYLNTDQYARVDVPPHADSSAPPDWQRVAGGSSRAWHDHRIHFMSAVPHPEIAADPDTERIVPGFDRWEVPFIYDGREYAVAGELRWIPGPAPWPWLLLALPLTLPALLGLRTQPVATVAEDGEPVQRWPGLVKPAAVVLGLSVLANTSHLVDDLFAVPLPWSILAFAAGQTALFLALGAFGAWRAWQGGDGAFTALGVGAGAVLVGQGLLLLPVLTASQLASLLPDTAVRLIVAASIVQALPVGAAAVIGARRLLPDADHLGAKDEPAGTG